MNKFYKRILVIVLGGILIPSFCYAQSLDVGDVESESEEGGSESIEAAEPSFVEGEVDIAGDDGGVLVIDTDFPTGNITVVPTPFGTDTGSEDDEEETTYRYLTEADISSVRDVVDQERRDCGLSEMGWEPAVGDKTYLNATHITQLRGALDELYEANGQEKRDYEDEIEGDQTQISLSYLNEIQGFLTAFEGCNEGEGGGGEPYCGDDICNGDDTCLTCSMDCGLCAGCPEVDSQYGLDACGGIVGTGAGPFLGGHRFSGVDCPSGCSGTISAVCIDPGRQQTPPPGEVAIGVWWPPAGHPDYADSLKYTGTWWGYNNSCEDKCPSYTSSPNTGALGYMPSCDANPSTCVNSLNPPSGKHTCAFVTTSAPHDEVAVGEWRAVPCPGVSGAVSIGICSGTFYAQCLAKASDPKNGPSYWGNPINKCSPCSGASCDCPQQSFYITECSGYIVAPGTEIGQATRHGPCPGSVAVANGGTSGTCSSGWIHGNCVPADSHSSSKHWHGWQSPTCQ